MSVIALCGPARVVILVEKVSLAPEYYPSQKQTRQASRANMFLPVSATRRAWNYADHVAL